MRDTINEACRPRTWFDLACTIAGVGCLYFLIVGLGG